MVLVNTLKGAAQSLTTSWTDYGAEIDTDGHEHISLWLDMDINDSQNARIRMLAKYASSGADEYVLPIKTVTSSVVTVESEYFEFMVDENQKRIIEFDLDNVVPFVQFQIQAGTVGSTAGQILDTMYTLR